MSTWLYSCRIMVWRKDSRYHYTFSRLFSVLKHSHLLFVIGHCTFDIFILCTIFCTWLVVFHCIFWYTYIIINGQVDSAFILLRVYLWLELQLQFCCWRQWRQQLPWISLSLLTDLEDFWSTTSNIFAWYFCTDWSLRKSACKREAP